MSAPPTGLISTPVLVSRNTPFVLETGLVGLLLGSFLNVCIARLPRHESIVLPGSHCPGCAAPIRPRDNIPVLSWLLLRGRCRSCAQPIAWRYPAVELATALLFMSCAWVFGPTIEAASAAVLSFLLLGLLVMDLETLLLPDTFTLTGLLLGVVHAGVISTGGAVQRLSDAGSALFAALSGALLVLAIRWGYWLVRRRHGMGLGDVKLVAMLGAWLGIVPTLLVLVLAVFASALVGLVLIAVTPRTRDWRTVPLPFGSFLAAAALVVVFVGKPMVDWYLGQFR